MSTMHWVEKDAKKYEKRRSEQNRKDMQFLTAERREQKICYNAKQVDAAIQRHLVEADRSHAKGERYVMVLDVEEPLLKKFSWLLRELELGGASNEIEKRWPRPFEFHIY